MHEKYDSRLVAGKLRRWSHYLQHYRLPTWEQIPTLGLYMDQVLTLLSRYLPFLPRKEKEEQIITTSAINNYVRMKLMPAPEKKKYNRIHIAYLIMICTLKHCLSIPTLQTMLPRGMTEAEVEHTYTAYVNRHRIASDFYVRQVREAAAGILDQQSYSELATDDTTDLIVSAAVISGFSRLLAEKLLLLDGKTLETGGSIEF